MGSTYLLTWTIWFIFNLLVSNSVHGFSTGTGACNGGQAPLGTAAVGSTHIRSTGQILGPLSDYGVELIINDVIVQPDTPTSFPPNVDLAWTVRTENPIQYKGILVRAEADLDFTLTTTDSLLKVDTVYCPQFENVIGITHVSGVLKSSSSGVLRFDAAGTAALDITVVYRNGASGEAPDNQSITGYNRFTLSIEEAQAPVATPVATPTDVPVDTPVATPTDSPVDTPVATPTDSPVDTPVATPTDSPVDTPVATPTDSPVDTPVATPTDSPVEAPIEAPVEAPNKPPAEAPVEAPNKPPAEAPVEAPFKGTKPPTRNDMGMTDEGMGSMDGPKTSKVKAKKGGKKMKTMKLRFLR